MRKSGCFDVEENGSEKRGQRDARLFLGKSCERAKAGVVRCRDCLPVRRRADRLISVSRLLLVMSKDSNDCYYFFNSSCSKGDNCSFRHCEAALGCETVCVFWKSGSCVRPDCRFRHAILRPSDPPSDRSRTLCYFESQPGGCQKSNCPFRHRKQQQRAENGETIQSDATPEAGDSVTNNSTAGAQAEQTSSLISKEVVPDTVEQVSIDVTSNEEESDTEDEKRQRLGKQTHAADGIVVKSLEQIRMERVFRQGDIGSNTTQKRQSEDEEVVRDKSQTKRVRLIRTKTETPANGQQDEVTEEKKRAPSLSDDLLTDLLDTENGDPIDCGKDDDILQEIDKIING